jgi:hypothetical protein
LSTSKGRGWTKEWAHVGDTSQLLASTQRKIRIVGYLMLQLPLLSGDYSRRFNFLDVKLVCEREDVKEELNNEMEQCFSKDIYIYIGLHITYRYIYISFQYPKPCYAST